MTYTLTNEQRSNSGKSFLKKSELLDDYFLGEMVQDTDREGFHRGRGTD